MGANQIINTLSIIGDSSGRATSNVVQWLSSVGIDITTQSAKILNMIIILSLIYLIIKFTTFSKPLVKWAIIILMVILLLSIVISFK